METWLFRPGNSSCHSQLLCLDKQGQVSTSSRTVHRFHSWPLTLLPSPVESSYCTTGIHTPACTLRRHEMSWKAVIHGLLLKYYHISHFIQRESNASASTCSECLLRLCGTWSTSGPISLQRSLPLGRFGSANDKVNISLNRTHTWTSWSLCNRANTLICVLSKA